jgi:hypothetical protein
MDNGVGVNKQLHSTPKESNTMATAKKKAPAAPSNAAAVPKGMSMISGGYAATWDVEKQDTLEGAVADKPRAVELTQDKKKVERRCIEVKTSDGERFTVWESAGLVNLFSAIEEKAPCTVWIHFRGFGTAKRGQNPPKLFDSAIG